MGRADHADSSCAADVDFGYSRPARARPVPDGAPRVREGEPVGIFEKARQAAEQAAEATRQAASQLSDPTTQQKARETLDAAGKQAKVGLGHARRGISTAIDRIDPTILADVIIKATSLQERANAALRDKGSPYRVSEIGIAASIPPQVTFSIGRIDDPEPVPAGQLVESTELVEELPTHQGEIVALDGTTVRDLPAGPADDVPGAEPVAAPLGVSAEMT
jgi:hypothetical protein